MPATTAATRTGALPHLLENGASLTQRLSALHDGLLERVPAIDRIACALYDAAEDLLKTFINSTRSGEPIAAYQFRLAESRSLSQLAALGEFRVIDEISAAIKGDNEHSAWLLRQGYRSSFTVPLYDNGALLGFVFFDSRQPAAFGPEVQRDIVLFTNLIAMSIASELAAVRAIAASAQVARDFANLRDFETGAHLERMARYARIIARDVAPRHGRGDEFVEQVFLFAPLHDIGKIGIADQILLKPGSLDPAERASMQSHVTKGGEMVQRILGDFGVEHLPDSGVMRNIVDCHHEFLDGSGYPRGLQGDAVPIEARIVTVADIFDALTSIRPYKKAWRFDDAMEELERMVAAGKLDGDCVGAIGRHREEIVAINQRFIDEA